MVGVVAEAVAVAVTVLRERGEIEVFGTENKKQMRARYLQAVAAVELTSWLLSLKHARKLRRV